MTYNPWDHAEQLGLTVIERPIRTANGLWVPDHQLIVLKTGMKMRHKRCVLAHEIGHADLGHRDDRPKHEVQANRYAAERLINHDHLLQLAEWIDNPHHLALELEVTHQLLRIYLNMTGLARTL
jgi:Zn-dependent peptidase ImmA (M78 family)